MPAKLAFVTYVDLRELIEGDRLAVAALERRDFTVDACLWDDANVDWGQYEAIVLRSCWDYHLRSAEFGAWLSRLESMSAPVWNPIDVLRWNMDKTYLGDLQDQGIELIPSVWLPQGAQVRFEHLLAEKKWDRAVIKPVVSASADNTLLVSASQANRHQADFDTLLQRGGVIVQEYAGEIETQGEWSFLFYGGEYSHAVVKRPKAGDFRVQPHLGGTHAAAVPPGILVEQARAVVKAVDTDLLYARVDAIERNGRLLLMELELIEPYLFFPDHPRAPERFADALVMVLGVKE
jgi:glutathione synthase/RimK-type ligase-like ATP-grasp enzyme